MEHLGLPSVDEIVSISDSEESERADSADSQQPSSRKGSSGDITISTIETIDSAADFIFESCYEIFQHLRKVIGWSSPFLKWLEIIVVLSVYVSIVTATYLAAFYHESKEVLIAFYVSDVVYGTNLLFMIFIALSPTSAWSTPSQLSYRRQCRKLSLIDMVTIIPWEFIVHYGPNLHSQRLLTNYIVVGRMNRLLRAYRLFRFFRNKKNQVVLGTRYADILSASCALSLLIHLSACYWYAINCVSYSIDTHHRRTCWASVSEQVFERSNIGNATFAYGSDVSTSLRSWTVSLLRVERTMNLDFVMSLYSISLYWATYTALGVGYGDYVGMRYHEVAFSIWVMLIGASIVNGMVVGSMTSLLTNVENHRAAFSHRLKVIMRYLRDNDYAEDLTQSIRGFYEYIWFKKKGQMEDNIYNTLPLSLQSEICLSVNRCALNRSPMFHSLDEGFLRSIALKIQNQFYLPGQMVINRGEVSRSMYYVVRGELQILSATDDLTPVAMLRPGKLFGEVNLVLNYARTASIRAATHCDLLVLQQNDVTPVLMHYPEARMAMWEYVRRLFQTDFEIDDENNAPESETTARSSTLIKTKFSPSLSPMMEVSETSEASSVKSGQGALELADVKGPQTPKEKAGEIPEDAKESKRTPKSEFKFPTIATASLKSSKDHEKDPATSKVPVFKDSTGSVTSTSTRSSLRFRETTRGSTSQPRDGKKEVKFRDPTRSSHIPAQSKVSLIMNEEKKSILAFHKPSSMSTEFGSSALKNRRFTWSRQMSIYKQIRRPNLYQHGQAEIQLDTDAAVLHDHTKENPTLWECLVKWTRTPPILGDGLFDTAWGAMVCVVVTVQWYMYLYYASFEGKYSPDMLMFTYFLDLFHILDIVFCLMTIRITPRETYLTYRDIWNYQLRCIGFYVNLLAALPLDLMVLPFLTHDTSARRRRMIAICKLNKLLRAWIIPERVRCFEDQLYVPLDIIRPLELIVYILMGIHFSACVWFMDSNVTDLIHLADSPGNDSWLMHYMIRKGNPPATSSPGVHPYILSLYWAAATMSTTGYGDIVAMTIPEYLISILVMVVGLVLFAYSLSAYASLLTNMERPKVKFQSVVFAMQQFMIENRIDKVLRKRVLRYMELQWRSYDGLVMPGKPDILHDLPEALQQDLASDGIVKILSNIPLLHGTDIAFRQELARKCSRHLFPPNEYVLYSGDLGRDMYVIIRGYCESFIGNRQKSLGLLGPGSRFGEAGMLYGLPRPAHVITRTHCDVLVIPHGEFQRILKEYPTINQEIKEAQEDPKTLYAVKLKHARVWHMSKQLPSIEAPTHKVDKPPSFNKFHKDQPDYMRPYDSLGRWGFLRHLMIHSTIRPDGQFAVQLESCKMAIALLVMITAPLQIALLPEDFRMYVVCASLDALSMCYIYMRLHSAYYNDWSLLVTHPLQTAKNYLSKAFLLDLMACFPFDLFAMMYFIGRVGENLDIIVLFRVNRVLQSYHIIIGFTHWDRESFFRGGAIKTVKYVFYFILYIHILSCFWAFMACPKVRLGGGTKWSLGLYDEGNEYDKDRHHNKTAEETICANGTWFSLSRFGGDTSALNIYVISMLFTLEMVASAGFGDLIPQTMAEYIFSIVLMIHGVIFFGYVIASVTATFVNADISRATFNERIKKLGKQMKHELVPPDLQQRVLSHVEYEFYRSQGMKAHALFTNLPPSIRGDVSIVLFEKLISSVPIFSTIDRSFHRMLSMCLKEAFFLANETVIHRGDMGQEMYFIHRGTCDVVVEDGSINVSLGPGRFFGEVSVMFSIPRTVTIRTRTNSDLFVLTRNDLHDVLENYPDIRREIERIAMERLQSSQKTSKVTVDDMSSSSRLSVTRSHPQQGSMASLREAHQGRKHKSHKRRSLVEQISNAIQSVPHAIERHRRISVLENEYEEMLAEEAQQQTQGKQRKSRWDLMAFQLQTIRKPWRAASVTGQSAMKGEAKMSVGSISVDGTPSQSAKTSTTERSTPGKTDFQKGDKPVDAASHKKSTRDNSKVSTPSARVTPALTLSGYREVKGSKTGKKSNIEAADSTSKEEVDETTPLEKKSSLSKDAAEKDSLNEIPSIEISPSKERIPSEAPEGTQASVTQAQSQAYKLSMSPSGAASAKSSEIYEVYVSNQSLSVESKMTIQPLDQEEFDGPGWRSPSRKSSAASDTPETRRERFQPPSGIIRAAEYIWLMLRKVIPTNFVFSPESNIILLFNLILCTFGLGEMILMFYQIAFYEDTFMGMNMHFVFGMGAIFYGANIYIRMHTAFYDSHRDLVRNYAEVKTAYMHRPTGFLVDLLSALPVDLLGYLGEDSGTLQHTVSTLRLIHLARFYIIYEFSYSCERRLNAPVLLLRSLRDFGVLLLILHFFACMWFIVACNNNVCLENTWVAHRNLLESTQMERYLNSLYYAAATMTSTGYGDIHPYSLREATFTILVIIVGKFIFGVIIGDLASTLSNQELARVEMETRLGVIVNQMKDQMVPKSLQKRVVQHVKYDWLRNRGHSLNDLLEHIPYCLRVEVFESIYGPQLRSISVFNHAPDHLIRRLSCMCEQQVFLPGDFIAKRGDIGTKVYIIRRGSVMVYQRSEQEPDYFLYSGAIYGDVQMVYPTIPYEHHLMAEYPSDVLLINQTDIQGLLADNPHFFFKIRRYIQEKYASEIAGRKATIFVPAM